MARRDRPLSIIRNSGTSANHADQLHSAGGNESQSRQPETSPSTIGCGSGEVFDRSAATVFGSSAASDGDDMARPLPSIESQPPQTQILRRPAIYAKSRVFPSDSA